MSNEKQPVLYPEGGEVTFVMPSTNALGVLKNAEKDCKLTASYMRWEDWQERKGKEIRCFFMGLKECVDEAGEIYHAAQFIDLDKNPFIAAQTILVDSLKNVRQYQGLVIKCTDVVSNSKKGKTVLFDIEQLSVNLMDLMKDANK